MKCGRWFRITAPILLLTCGNLLADSGYKTDYDFPDQGIDWYGSPGSFDLKYDFPSTFMETFSDGDDFGFGYEVHTDLYGFGPPTVLTNTRNFEYRFRFGMFGIVSGGLCATNNDCSDGFFCNGSEICNGQFCGQGTPPSCGDTNSCTIDFCDEVFDQCQHIPRGDPGEVSGMWLDLFDPATSVATVDWNSQARTNYYNVYRGEVADLRDLNCYAGGVTASNMDDDGLFSPGGLFLYLVTAYGCGSESTLGTNSAGVERIYFSGCP